MTFTCPCLRTRFSKKEAFFEKTNVFSSRFSFYFLPIETQRIFFHILRAKIFFSGQSKNKIFFSKQHICLKCILLDLYVRVFLEPSIHGMSFICSCSSWILGPSVLFFNLSYPVTSYPVDALHFT